MNRVQQEKEIQVSNILNHSCFLVTCSHVSVL